MGPLSEQRLDAEVMFYGLWMQDIGASFADEPAADTPFGSSDGARLVTHSAGHTHTAELAAEVWDEVHALAQHDVPEGVECCLVQFWPVTES